MTKLLIGIKIIIVIYSIWRFTLSLFHIIANNLAFSSKTFLSIAILLSCSLLFCATLLEARFLIEIWLICFILKFGAIIFGVSSKNLIKSSLKLLITLHSFLEHYFIDLIESTSICCHAHFISFNANAINEQFFYEWMAPSSSHCITSRQHHSFIHSWEISTHHPSSQIFAFLMYISIWDS